MFLHAKILGQRGEYESAFRIFEKKILPRLSPTRKAPSAFSNIQGIDVNDSPHRAYALLRAAHDQHFDSEESRRKADEAIRIAALEYNNPDALAEYASVMMNENNLDMYEECMCKAATAGHEKAAFYMANFYYLTYLGKYPTRGERDSNQNRWPPAWMSRLMGLDKDKADPNSDSASSLLAKSMTYLASFLNRSLPQKDYQRLALHWYILAWNQSRNSSAGFMMALLAREMATSDGGREDAGILFEMAKEQGQDPELRVHIAALEKNWFNPDYEATLPKKFMAVR